MRSAKDILAGADDVNSVDARADRLNLLSQFSERVTEFVQILKDRGKGPSLREMNRILDDIEARTLKMRQYDL